MIFNQHKKMNQIRSDGDFTLILTDVRYSLNSSASGQGPVAGSVEGKNCWVLLKAENFLVVTRLRKDSSRKLVS
jgi:hypothetical protein